MFNQEPLRYYQDICITSNSASKVSNVRKVELLLQNYSSFAEIDAVWSITRSVRGGGGRNGLINIKNTS